MNKEWSLDVLYKGLDYPKYKEDVKKFEGMADFLKNEYEKALELDDVNKVKTLLLAEEEYARDKYTYDYEEYKRLRK